MVSRFPAALEGGDLTPPLAHKKGRRISSSRITPSDTSRRPSGDHFRTTSGHRRYLLHPLSVSTMAQSIVPLVIVLLASSLALSNANGRGMGNYVMNPVFCQGKADGLYVNPAYPHSFYQCSNSVTYLKQCPANLLFNPAISVCDWPVVNSAFCQDKADGMYADPSDSQSFYHCSNSLTYHKQCPANLVFNPAISVCDWPRV
ncbi:chitin-binding domain protein cbd-1-like [Lampetra planeri]